VSCRFSGLGGFWLIRRMVLRATSDKRFSGGDRHALSSISLSVSAFMSIHSSAWRATSS
jgi:hypothetical protein